MRDRTCSWLGSLIEVDSTKAVHPWMHPWMIKNALSQSLWCAYSATGIAIGTDFFRFETRSQSAIASKLSGERFSRNTSRASNVTLVSEVWCLPRRWHFQRANRSKHHMCGDRSLGAHTFCPPMLARIHAALSSRRIISLSTSRSLSVSKQSTNVRSE